MDGDATQESEVPRVVEEGGDDTAGGKEKAGKKSKRRFQKPQDITDFYSPAAYTPQKGGRGKGKGEGKGDREGGKGKGKNNYYNDSPQTEKPQDDAVNSAPSVPPGPVMVEGDGSQPKGASAKQKKSTNKGRGEGKGNNKGNSTGGKTDAPRKGGGRGGGGCGGKAPRSPTVPNDMPEPMPEVEGARPPGPQQQQQQQRPPVTMKGAMAPAGMPGVPMAPQFQYSVPSFPYQGAPNMSYQYQMPGIYTVPAYCVMQPPSMGTFQPPFMPGGMPQGAPQSMGPTLDRTTIVTQARLQVEHYFSMENLLKDMFLRKNMDQEGWVNIQLIADWPAMKTKLQNQDPSILTEAITTSQLVEADPSQTRLRLRRDWEKWVVPQQNSSPPMQPGAASLPPPMRPPV